MDHDSELQRIIHYNPYGQHGDAFRNPRLELSSNWERRFHIWCVYVKWSVHMFHRKIGAHIFLLFSICFFVTLLVKLNTIYLKIQTKMYSMKPITPNIVVVFLKIIFKSIFAL